MQISVSKALTTLAHILWADNANIDPTRAVSRVLTRTETKRTKKARRYLNG